MISFIKNYQFILILLVQILLLKVSCAQSTHFKGKVIGIKDGDTIDIIADSTSKKETIRLWGIDCPEKQQAFGQVAKRYLSDKCYDKRVTIVSHGRDKYNRLLGLVISTENDTLNLRLIREGLAWHYMAGRPEIKYWKKLEDEARISLIGLWIDLGTIKPPIAPWDFRHGNIQN